MRKIDGAQLELDEAARDARMVRRLKGSAAVLLLVLAAASFAAGIPGLLAAGRWAQLGEAAWLTPIAIDGGLVFFSASAMAWRAETAKASLLGWTMVVLLTLVSVASQVAHVLGENPEPAVQDFVGAGVASMFPLLVLASTRQFEMLRFSRLIDREAARVAATDAEAALRVPESAPVPPTKPVQPPRTQKPVAPAAARTEGADAAGEQRVRQWVLEQLKVGERPTAAEVGERLGKSKASGLRFINRVAADLEQEREQASGRLLELVQSSPARN